MERAYLRDFWSGVPMAALLYGPDVLLAPVSFTRDPGKLRPAPFPKNDDVLQTWRSDR